MHFIKRFGVEVRRSGFGRHVQCLYGGKRTRTSRKRCRVPENKPTRNYPYALQLGPHRKHRHRRTCHSIYTFPYGFSLAHGSLSGRAPLRESARWLAPFSNSLARQKRYSSDEPFDIWEYSQDQCHKGQSHAPSPVETGSLLDFQTGCACRKNRQEDYQD